VVSSTSMSSLASILDRFRRGAGVPAVVAEDPAAELTAVFVALAQLDAEARTLREEAIREAERGLAEAEARRSEIMAGWRERARVERERVEADRMRVSAGEVEAVLADAQTQARVLRERGEKRLPAMVEEVLTCVRAAAQ